MTRTLEKAEIFLASEGVIGASITVVWQPGKGAGRQKDWLHFKAGRGGVFALLYSHYLWRQGKSIETDAFS